MSLSDGSIAVLDAGDREVRLFDGQGSFVRRVGGPGEGPGEFRLPQLLERLPGDTLLVWDAGLTRLSWFDVRGTLIQEARVAPEAMGRVAMAHGLDDGTVTLVVAQQPGAATDLPREGTWRQEAALVQWESPEEEPRKWADVPGAEFLMSVAGGSGEMTMVTMGTTWHAPSLLTAASRGRIWRGDGARWELEVWDPARGEVEQVVRFDAPLEPFDEAFIRELHAHELDGVDDDARREAVQRRHRSAEYPDRIPPFRALRAGSDGRLWMGLTRTPPEPLPSGAGFELRDWLVLDGDGSILGRVVLPPRTQLLYAASDHILVVRFDELDLPYLERFRLEPPSGGEPGE